MKNLLLFICALFLKLSPGVAQISEHSLAFGFNTHPDALELLTNGNYVVVGRGVTIPGGVYSDTIFAVIFDYQGALLHKRRLQLPVYEVRDIRDLAATSDGGFVVAVSLGYCDVPTNECVVQRYDSTGQLIWSREPDDNNKLGSQFFLSSDGNLIGTDRSTFVIKLYINDGTTLWTYPMQDPGLDFLSIRDFEVIPGTDNLIAVGWPDFQYWSKGTISGEIKYVLTNSLSIPPLTSPGKLIGKASGFYYTFVDSALYRFIQFNTYEQLKKFSYEIKDAIVSNQNINLLCRQGDTHRLVTTDLAGQIISDVVLPINSWISGSLVGFHNSTFVIAGINGSGPIGGVEPWEEYNATNLWIRTFTDPTLSPTESDNAAATGIMQEQPITVSEIYLPVQQETRYKIEGGAFYVQVTNQGQTLLENIDVLVGFQWNVPQYCLERPVHRRHYTGLDLAPGESVWLDFGDVFADLQPSVPAEICFWTSAPNERPDGNHDNDTYCQTLVVSTSEPEQVGQLHIFPNPTADFLKIELPEHIEASQWQLFNASGRLVATGPYPAGERMLEIRTGGIGNGLYIFKLGSSTNKIVINR